MTPLIDWAQTVNAGIGGAALALALVVIGAVFWGSVRFVGQIAGTFSAHRTFTRDATLARLQAKAEKKKARAERRAGYARQVREREQQWRESQTAQRAP